MAFGASHVPIEHFQKQKMLRAQFYGSIGRFEESWGESFGGRIKKAVLKNKGKHDPSYKEVANIHKNKSWEIYGCFFQIQCQILNEVIR